jgi:hypothetical protein
LESAGLGVWVGNPVPTDVLQVQIAPLRSAPMSALPESSLHGLARGKMLVFSLTLYWKNQNQNAIVFELFLAAGKTKHILSDFL